MLSFSSSSSDLSLGWGRSIENEDRFAEDEYDGGLPLILSCLCRRRKPIDQFR